MTFPYNQTIIIIIIIQRLGFGLWYNTVANNKAIQYRSFVSIQPAFIHTRDRSLSIHDSVPYGTSPIATTAIHVHCTGRIYTAAWHHQLFQPTKRAVAVAASSPWPRRPKNPTFRMTTDHSMEN